MAFVCSDCGYRINGGCDPGNHVCDERSLIRYQMCKFDENLEKFLNSKQGRFEQHYAKYRQSQFAQHYGKYGRV